MQKKKKFLRFEDLIKFPTPARRRNQAKIIVHQDGMFSVSSAVIRSIREDSEKMLADFRHSEDYRVIMIRPDPQQGFEFPKTGRVTPI